MTEQLTPAPTEPTSIYAALAKSQAEFAPVRKNRKANYGMYADLGEILAATVPALNKHGIYLFQRVTAAEGGVNVETVLAHESGESISSGVLFMPSSAMKGGNAAQAFGSAKTYACRYQLSSFLGIAADDDDDGQTAAPRGSELNRRSAAPQPEPPHALTQADVDAASAAASRGMDAYSAYWQSINAAKRKELTNLGWHEKFKSEAAKVDTMTGAAQADGLTEA